MKGEGKGGESGRGKVKGGGKRWGRGGKEVREEDGRRREGKLNENDAERMKLWLVQQPVTENRNCIHSPVEVMSHTKQGVQGRGGKGEA